jgi:hypothetical protein
MASWLALLFDNQRTSQIFVSFRDGLHERRRAWLCFFFQKKKPVMTQVKTFASTNFQEKKKTLKEGQKKFTHF